MTSLPPARGDGFRRALQSLEHTVPPPVVAALVALAMWWVASWGPVLDIPAAAKHVLTLLWLAVGLSFDVLGLLAFRAAHTTINPLKPERAAVLVTRGVYRITRNPMYVGLGCLLLAWATYLAAPLALTGVVLFVLYLTRFQIQPEERALRLLFGEDYLRYTARVRRWL